jgi:hypothetical protein
MAKFNKAAWVRQELAKFTAENYADLRRAHRQTLELAEKYGLDASHSGVPELLLLADAKFGPQR